MYGFRILHAEYLMNISIEHDGKSESSLETVYSVNAKYQNGKETFLFTINRKQVKMNSKKKDNGTLVDRMMQRLGDVLYPITLIVSKSGNILGVKNFAEVCSGWNNVANTILNETYSAPTKKYIDMAKTNMMNEAGFIQSFVRQTFIQLLFRDSMAESFWFTTRNLTDICSTDSVRCDRVSEKDNVACFTTVGDWDSECRFEYAFSELGDILSAKGYVKKELADVNSTITKNISLIIHDDRREVKKANKLISF